MSEIKNKIADFSVRDDAGQNLLVASTVDEFPHTKIYDVEITLFNIDYTSEYSIKVKRENGILNSSKITLNKDNMGYSLEKNIGKSAIIAPVTLVIEEASDFYITAELYEKSILVSQMTKYFTFSGV